MKKLLLLFAALLFCRSGLSQNIKVFETENAKVFIVKENSAVKIQQKKGNRFLTDGQNSYNLGYLFPRRLNFDQEMEIFIPYQTYILVTVVKAEVFEKINSLKDYMPHDKFFTSLNGFTSRGNFTSYRVSNTEKKP